MMIKGGYGKIGLFQRPNKPRENRRSVRHIENVRMSDEEMDVLNKALSIEKWNNDRIFGKTQFIRHCALLGAETIIKSRKIND